MRKFSILILSLTLSAVGQNPKLQNSRPQPSPGKSTMFSAERLVRYCRATIVDYDSSRAEIGTDGTHCLGYVQGVIETATLWQVANVKSPEATVPLFCLGAKATHEVIIRRIPIWAAEHPEDLKGSALEFMMSMLVGSYPCPSK